MSVYGCVVCCTPRPKEADWWWIATHRGLGCTDARWGLIDNG